MKVCVCVSACVSVHVCAWRRCRGGGGGRKKIGACTLMTVGGG